MNASFVRTAVLLGLSLAFSVSARADNYDLLRAKWADLLTGGNLNTADTELMKLVNGNPAIPGDDGIADKAQTFSGSMQTGSGRTNLWTDLPNVIWNSTTVSTLNTGNMVVSYERLATMALALRAKGSDVEFVGAGSAAAQTLRNRIKDGVDWLYLNAYKNNRDKADIPIDYPNQDWFHTEIAIPGGLGQILVLLSTGPFAGGNNGGFTEAQIKDYTRPMLLKQRNRDTLSGTSGQNGAWKVRTWAYLGVLRKDTAPLDQDNGNGESPRAFFAEGCARIPFLTQTNIFNGGWDSEGFRSDGSFYGHINHAYTGGYGQGYYGIMLPLLELYTGNVPPSWNIDLAAATSRMTDWLINGSDYAMHRAQYFQSVRGRYITRSTLDVYNGVGTVFSAIRLAELAAPTDQAKLRSAVKAWASNPGIDIYTREGRSIPDYLRAQRFAAIQAGITARAPLDAYRQFTETSTTAVHRTNWGAGISMFTKDNIVPAFSVASTELQLTDPTGRPLITSNESSGSDAHYSAYVGSGGLQVINEDSLQYDSDYYANLDWKRIPGTTINGDASPVAKSQRHRNLSNFAGGVSLGRYGVTGFELQPNGTALGKFHARKAWFFFDEEIVALGSDIRLTDGATHNVHTTIQNWRMNSANSNAFKVATSASSGTAMTAPASNFPAGVRKAWQEGNPATTPAHLGYYFPNATNLALNRDPSGGIYYNKFWISHGQAQNGSYAYVLLPNFTEAQTNTYANAPEISVIENSADVQAVSKPSLGLTGALFLNAQTRTIPFTGTPLITSNTRAAVMVEETDDTITLAASDPTWENQSSMTIQLHRKVSSWESKTNNLNVNQTTPTISMTANTADARGKTFTLVIYKRFEPERNANFLVNSSGDPYVIYTNEAGASNGGILSFNANAVNDFATFKLWHLMSGTYRILVKYRTGNNRAQVGLSVSADQSTWETKGNQNYDAYSSSSTYVVADLGTITIPASGVDRYFKFTATGKNASSSSYRIVIDSIELEPL